MSKRLQGQVAVITGGAGRGARCGAAHGHRGRHRVIGEINTETASASRANARNWALAPSSCTPT